MSKTIYHLLNIPFYLVVAVLSFWQFWPYQTKIEQINPETHRFTPAIARAGETVFIHREYRVYSNVDVRIVRKLVKQESEDLVIYNLSTVEGLRKPGIYRHNRQLKIPKIMEPGHYIFANYICYKLNPIREHCYDSVPVPIEIIE